MEKEELKKRYLNYLSDWLNNLEYTEIDSFCEDNELNEYEIEYLYSFNVRVIENIKGE